MSKNNKKEEKKTINNNQDEFPKGETELGTEEINLKETKIELSIEEKLEDLSAKNIMILAEMENLRKTHVKEKTELSKYFMSSFLSDFILSLEMFESAIGTKTVSDEMKNWLIGFEMIYKNMFESLEKHGLKKIEVNVDDSFDPHLHEPIDQQFSSKIKEGRILEIKRNGYKLNDRLIRPSTIILSKGIEKNKKVDEE